MTTSTMRKDGLEMYGTTTLYVFGYGGFKNGAKWAIKPPDFPCFIETTPEPALPEIQECINNDIKNGDFDKIDHVRISPETGILLFLDGTITPTHIREEAETTSVVVVLPRVLIETSLGQKPFKVIIDSEVEYPIATIDLNGNIV